MLGTVISDQGTEFTGRNFIEKCRNNGIDFSIIPAYTPQLNGQIESKWKHIMHGCRKWLMQSQLPPKYWTFAAKHEVYIQNLTSTVTIKVSNDQFKKATPYQLLFRQKPSIGHLRQFGCTTYSFIPEQLRQNQNFSDRALQGKLLGYAEVPEITNNNIVVNHSAILVVSETINHPRPAIKFVDRDNCSFIEVQVTSYSTLNGEDVVSADDDEEREEEEIQPSKVPKTDSTQDSLIAQLAMAVKHTLEETATRDDLTDTTNIQEQDVVSLYDAMTSENQRKWILAMIDELQSIETNRVWFLTERPPNKRLLGCKWVLRIKLTEELLLKFKARLVVLGYQAIDGEDYLSLTTFAPVAKMASFRIFLSIITQYSMFVIQIDVDKAFQNAILDEDIYLELPEMYVDLMQPDLSKFKQPCLKLNKALYGLPQAPKAWFITIDSTLRELQYIPLRNEPCLYKKVDNEGRLIAITVLYVDDLLIANTNQMELETIVRKLQITYKLKVNRDLRRILGINVTYNKDLGITTIHQMDKIEELYKSISINDDHTVKLPTIPLDYSVKYYTSKAENSEQLTGADTYTFRKLLGKLMYIMTTTRPDICFSVSLLSRANTSPMRKHMQGVIHLIRYLYNTRHWKLTFKKHHPVSYKLLAYSDSDWATDRDNRRSQTGGVILLGGTPIIWISTQQTAVAVSSTEAEINALREVTKHTLWIRHVMKELGLLSQQFVPIYEDNTSAILLVHNPAVNSVNRHTDISPQFVTEHIVEFKTISVEHIPSHFNLADIFTKLMKEPRGSELIYALFQLYNQPNGIHSI